jgi:hypothetical protein
MHRSAYISHGMGRLSLATATRPRNADKVKGTTSTKGSSFLVEKPAMRRRVIPGMRTPMVMRRSWRAERWCDPGPSMMCTYESDCFDARREISGCNFDVQHEIRLSKGPQTIGWSVGPKDSSPV